MYVYIRFRRAAATGALISGIVIAGASSSFAFPIAATGDGLDVVVGSTGDIIATYEGNSAAFSNDLYL